MLFAIVIDVVTSEIKVCTLHEILYADDLFLIAETMAELHKEIYNWKSALESESGENKGYGE